MATTLNDIATLIKDLDLRLTGRLDGVDGLLDEIDGRLGTVESSLGTVDDRLVGVEHQLTEVKGRLTDVEGSQREVIVRLEGVEGETKALHNDVIELYGLVPVPS